MLPEAAQVEEALVNVQREYDETRYQSFSEDELLQYAYLTEKIKKNMQKVLTINMQKTAAGSTFCLQFFTLQGKLTSQS